METARIVMAGLLGLALTGCGGAADQGSGSATLDPTLVAPATIEPAAQPAVQPAAGKVDVRGQITKIDPAAGANPRMLLIEGEQSPDIAYPSARVRVPDGTPIFRREGATRVPATLDDLALDVSVEVVFDGPVTRSLPPQGTAAEVVILP